MIFLQVIKVTDALTLPIMIYIYTEVRSKRKRKISKRAAVDY